MLLELRREHVMTHTVLDVGQPVAAAESHVARGCGLKGTGASRLGLIHFLDLID